MRETISLYAIVMLGVLVLLLWHRSFGLCSKCNLHREPSCGCDPEGRRRPWRNMGRRR